MDLTMLIMINMLIAFKSWFAFKKIYAIILLNTTYVVLFRIKYYVCSIYPEGNDVRELV